MSSVANAARIFSSFPVLSSPGLRSPGQCSSEHSLGAVVSDLEYSALGGRVDKILTYRRQRQSRSVNFMPACSLLASQPTEAHLLPIPIFVRPRDEVEREPPDNRNLPQSEKLLDRELSQSPNINIHRALLRRNPANGPPFLGPHVLLPGDAYWNNHLQPLQMLRTGMRKAWPSALNC